MMSSSSFNSPLMDVDPAKQFEWHESYRDVYRNQYRTSYTDMAHGRETSVKSDYPSGYGGHIPSLRFDILHRNTAFDRNTVLRRSDPSRDALPSFKDQLEGIPTYCAKPQGAKKNPTYGVVVHDGSTNPRPPWAVLRPVMEVPGFRAMPATLSRARSLPSVSAGSGLQRANMAAQNLGASMASRHPKESFVEQPVTTPNVSADPLKRTVMQANNEARQQVMPSEQEMLMEEVMRGQP
jgi:hypothetical protein